jgi:hypothetical protein
MYGESVFAALVEAVEADDAEVSTFLEIDIFGFGIMRMYGVIVKLPGYLDVCPEGGDRMSDPRLAIACVRPQILLAKVSILEVGPFFGPVSLEECMPSDSILCYNCTATLSRVSNGVDGLAIEPSFNGFEEDNHEFEIGVVQIEVGSHFEQERGAPCGDSRTSALEKMSLNIRFTARNTILRGVARFGFVGLAWENLVNELEDKLVTGTRVLHSRSETGEVDGVERGQIPVMDGLALLEEVILGGSFPDVMLVVSGDSIGAYAELDFGRWDERDFVLNGRGMAEMERSSGFVSIYIKLSGE